MGGGGPQPPREASYFPDPGAFRAWLEEHHAECDELWVGYYKKATGRPSQTWSESVDQALCFGWIDGIRRSVDEERYVIRFTPRGPRSRWSRVNLEKYEALDAAGLVTPAGAAAFARRRPDEPAGYSYEHAEPSLAPEHLARFREQPEAWAFFESQPPGYRRTAIAWVNAAKREETRTRRVETLIDDSSRGLRIKQLRR